MKRVIIMRGGHEEYTHDGEAYSQIETRVAALLQQGWQLFGSTDTPQEYEQLKDFDPKRDELIVIPPLVGG